MTHAPLASYLNMLGGIVVLLLGILVLLPKPRTRAATAFSVFAAGLGGYYFANHASAILHAPEGIVLLLAAVPLALWFGGVLAMLVTFPRNLSRRERPLLVVSILAIGVLAVPLLIAVHTSGSEPAVVAILDARGFAIHSLYALFLILPLRFMRSDDASFRRQTGFAAIGIALFVGYQAGGGVDFAGNTSPLRADGARLAEATVRLAAVLLAAGLWLTATRGPEARLARNVALITLATTLAGLLSVALSVPGGHGIARVLMALALAYAILRHQLLGLDVKVRWGISRSTIAAAFVAAFFLASEGAQILFGQGNEWVGLLGAGALVFALAPLQRAAERLAERAVPVAPEPPRHAMQENSAQEVAYKAAVRLALRGGITRAEELDLARIAEAHGLPHVRARELRSEVEDAWAKEEIA